VSLKNYSTMPIFLKISTPLREAKHAWASAVRSIGKLPSSTPLTTLAMYTRVPDWVEEGERTAAGMTVVEHRGKHRMSKLNGDKRKAPSLTIGCVNMSRREGESLEMIEHFQTLSTHKPRILISNRAARRGGKVELVL
jgi:hypothetical protein